MRYIIILVLVLVLAGCKAAPAPVDDTVEYIKSHVAIPVESKSHIEPGQVEDDTCFVVEQHTNKYIHGLGLYCKVDLGELD